MLAYLYGDQFHIKNTGAGRILVLGQHNSGTSITTRLIMLLGAFQGSSQYISVNQYNKLKFFELRTCINLNEYVLHSMSDRRFHGYHAQGLDFDKLKRTSEPLHSFKVLSFIQGGAIHSRKCHYALCERTCLT